MPPGCPGSYLTSRRINAINPRRVITSSIGLTSFLNKLDRGFLALGAFSLFSCQGSHLMNLYYFFLFRKSINNFTNSFRKSSDSKSSLKSSGTFRVQTAVGCISGGHTDGLPIFAGGFGSFGGPGGLPRRLWSVTPYIPHTS